MNADYAMLLTNAEADYVLKEREAREAERKADRVRAAAGACEIKPAPAGSLLDSDGPHNEARRHVSEAVALLSMGQYCYPTKKVCAHLAAALELLR
jgi:hypothetical protein